MSEPLARRVHRMPFGAQPAPEGGVRFRLWAPGANRVELWLQHDDGTEQTHPMRGDGDGWYTERREDAGPGTLYAYRVDGGPHVPDPASRYQPQGVHGPSRVEAAEEFAWSDGAWGGRPWEEVVLYELHVGSFTREGSFAAVGERLEHLAGLGVTAIELMPIAEFPGRRNWGYDGTLPFAPHAGYGRPEELKRLVQEAHGRGLMVFLDVVYNHFGPEGNYLHLYAAPFFTSRHRTPWGEAIDFEGPRARTVRQFFIHNALYWLEEFHLDGLRLDAVHAIHDRSSPSFLDQLAQAVHEGPGAGRHVHLVLENDDNAAGLLRRSGPGPGYVAQWNDDVHHALHCLLTGESGGYYADYAGRPASHLARGLSEGFAYQGDPSPYRDGAPRGEPSGHLPPTAFVNFLQNHDQVGNRAMGERLAGLVPEDRLRPAVALLLLAPSIPLLFMGEEAGSRRPFAFFCDFGPELARAVTRGRRREFARFAQFRDPARRREIPDPNAPATFASAVLDWSRLVEPAPRRWLELYRELLALRRREIVPRLGGVAGGRARGRALGERAVRVEWTLGDGARLTLLANLGDEPLDAVEAGEGRALFAAPEGAETAVGRGRLGPWTTLWWLDERPGGGGRR